MPEDLISSALYLASIHVTIAAFLSGGDFCRFRNDR